MQKNVVVMAMSTLALGRRKEGEIPKNTSLSVRVSGWTRRGRRILQPGGAIK